MPRPTALVITIASGMLLGLPAAFGQTTPTPTPTATTTPASPASKEPVEVILNTRDGRVFTGMLVSRTDEGVTLDIGGVPTTFKAIDVERTRELPPVLERYKQMRDATPPDEVERRAELINWLVDRRHLDIALLEAEILASRNPRSGAARKLLEGLQLKDQLLQPAKPGPAPARTPPNAPATPQTEPADTQPEPEQKAENPDVPQPAGASIPVTDFPLLSAKQINLLKVFELDLSAEPNLVIPRSVVQQLLDTYASSPLIPASREGRDAILRQPPLQTMDLIYRLKAREFYDRVTVIDHPEPLRRFRDDVNRSVILNACATNACHGGSEAGRLVFATFRANADPTLYTNFYILQKFRTASGDSLLNFENPERSPIVQLGMPRDIARVKHPPVIRDGRDVWRAAFSGPDDRRYQATVEWIKSLYRPRPSYDLEYTPFRPFEKPAKPVFENVER